VLRIAGVAGMKARRNLSMEEWLINLFHLVLPRASDKTLRLVWRGVLFYSKK
jgi:hypothetical protein